MAKRFSNVDEARSYLSAHGVTSMTTAAGKLIFKASHYVGNKVLGAVDYVVRCLSPSQRVSFWNAKRREAGV